MCNQSIENCECLTSILFLIGKEMQYQTNNLYLIGVSNDSSNTICSFATLLEVDLKTYDQFLYTLFQLYVNYLIMSNV